MLHKTQSSPGTSAGAVAAWNRRNTEAEESQSLIRRLRRQGLLQSIIGLTLGTLFWFFWHRGLAPVVWTLATLNGLAAWLSPTGIYASISRILEALGRGIGSALTVLLLTPLYWIFFAPFGLLFRRGGRDRLKRRLDPDAETYWIQRPTEETSLERYERQF